MCVCVGLCVWVCMCVCVCVSFSLPLSLSLFLNRQTCRIRRSEATDVRKIAGNGTECKQEGGTTDFSDSRSYDKYLWTQSMGVCSQPPAQEPFRPNCFRSARQKKRRKKREKRRRGISSYLSRRQSSQQALQPKRSPVQLMVTACGFFFILFFLNTQTQELCESRMESVDESVPFKAKTRTIDDNGVWLFFFFFFS